jgi:hypothetical protein
MSLRGAWKFFFCLTLAVGLCACSVGGQYGAGPRPQESQEIENQSQLDRLSPFTSNIACQMEPSEARRNIDVIFPWPLPPPTSQHTYTNEVIGVLRNNQSTIKLGDVDQFLIKKMEVEGDPPFRYYVTPDQRGYVAITVLDKIDARGRRLGESESVSALSRFLRNPFALPPGRYRALVFIVTNSPEGKKDSQIVATYQLAKQWASGGCSNLPPELADIDVGTDYNIYLRAYEIVGRGDESHLVDRAEALSTAQLLAALDVNLGGSK